MFDRDPRRTDGAAPCHPADECAEHLGLSKRERFALEFMAARLRYLRAANTASDRDEVAGQAVELADALVAALNAPPTYRREPAASAPLGAGWAAVDLGAEVRHHYLDPAALGDAPSYG